MDDSAPSSITPLAVDVLEYLLVEDSNIYQNHVFVLQVWLEQNMYKIQRSYAAFVELDYKLRYQYPRSQLPNLPLAGAYSSVSKAPSRRFSTASTAADVTPSSNHAATEKPGRKLLKRKDPNEVISSKRGPLSQYLRDLIRVPEILVSETLLTFLDEESVDGADVEEFSEEAVQNMEITLLLQDEEVVTKTVRKEVTVAISPPAESVVLWSFTTEHHNIGFSVLYNDVEVVAYQRYNAHEKAVRGYMEIRGDESGATKGSGGEAKLVWDNSFSKWRSKTLHYQVKVVSASKYELAQQKSATLKTKKISMFRQRNVLKKALARLSTELLQLQHPMRATIVGGRVSFTEGVSGMGGMVGVAGGSGVGSEIDGGVLKYLPADMEDISVLKRQIETLHSEKAYLHHTLNETERYLVQERTACAEGMKETERLQQEREALQQELWEVRNEFEAVKQEYADYVQTKESGMVGGRVYPPDALLTLPEEELNNKSIAVSNFLNLISFARNLMQQNEEFKAVTMSQEAASGKLKAEKKQLKSFAIQTKERVETLECEVKALEHDKLLLAGETEQLKNRVVVLEKTIAALREEAAIREGGPLAGYTNMGGRAVDEQEGGKDGERESHDPDDGWQRGADADKVTVPKLIVHDFSQVEPDELSLYLDVMATQLREMVPTWDDLLGGGSGGGGAEEEVDDAGTESSWKEEGEGASMSSAFSRLKRMSFGF